MKKVVLFLMTGLLLIAIHVLADDVVIDGSGNVETGISSPSGGGNLDVTGESGKHAIRGVASGTGAAGIYGISKDSGYGVLGTAGSGVGGYFSSSTGYGLIVENGNVGIGIGDPRYSLHVQGTINASTAIKINGTDVLTSYTETDPLVNPLGKASLSCSDTQIAKYIGSVWTCAVDLDTDTTYLAGTGLDLTGNTFDIEVPLSLTGTDNLGIILGTNSSSGNIGSFATVAAGVKGETASANGVWGYSTGSGTGVFGYSIGTGPGGVFSSTQGYGLLVTMGNVGIGTPTPAEKLSVDGIIESMNGGVKFPDGTVLHSAVFNPPVQNPRVNTLTAVDTAGNVGQYTSITIGTDGFPVISYFDYTNSDLKVARCGNASCSSGNTLTAVDTAGSVGRYSSITTGTDGYPVISYVDSSNYDLKVAKCGNASCSSGNTLTIVDAAGTIGSYTSIITGLDGLPVIAYIDTGNLKVAKCGNASCLSGNTLTIVDSVGSVYQYVSIAMATDGLPVIAYYETQGDDLKVAKCGDPACLSGNTITTVDSHTTRDIGWYTSMTIGTDGLPVISYFDNTNSDLKVAKCGNASCSSGNIKSIVDTAANTGAITSITIGTDGLPIISYHGSGSLKVAKCGDTSCSSGNTLTAVDPVGGYSSSITIGIDGLPVISYYDTSTNQDLKIARCANPFCLNNWSRR